MYSILLVVELPDPIDYRNEQPWAELVTKLATLAGKNKDIVRLGENCLLLPLTQGLQGIYDVVRVLGNFSYKYTIFDQEIKWHEGTKII